VWVSWSSLRDVRAHGFYRFFAWESILGLALLNIDYWFDEPFSTDQMISWTLLFICSYLVIHGALLLYVRGKPSRVRDDPTLVGIERTTQLVTGGIYRYIRHPIYSSGLFLAWGVFFKHLAPLPVGLAVIATYCLIMTAKKEEAENLRYFGDSYESYMKRT
jgi:protein-S-isoprenylcysteine O-methyltransferase Ste14